MTATLVEALQSIEKAPEIVRIDKEREYRKLLDEWRERHQLVDKLSKGEVSIPLIINELYEKYRGWRLFLPILKDDGYDKQLDELGLDKLLSADGFRTDKSQRVGGFLDWFDNKIARPITLSLLFGGIMALISGGQGRFESEIANYSTFFGAGVFAGMIGGYAVTLVKYSRFSTAMEQAKYLDTKIKEIYHI